MGTLKVAACYYPTTVVIVDDDMHYLNGIELFLENKRITCKTFFKPSEALQFLQQYKLTPFTQRCITRPEEDLISHRNIDIDVKAIWQEVYNPSRFAEISVLIVDYAMPNMNGLDLAKECRLLKNCSFKILLLTGEANEGQAVEAFNDKIIDKFIRKDAANFKEIFNSTVRELQNDYFLDLSHLVIDSLTKDPDHPVVTWLDEPGFFKIFDEIYRTHDVTEYYLADTFGSYMFLDFNGSPSWLVIKAEEEMRAAYEMARDSDTPFPNALLQSMKNREQIIYLHEHRGFTYDPEEAQNSIHPATKLVGNKETFYYAFVGNSKAYNIHSEEIASYKSYLTGKK